VVEAPAYTRRLLAEMIGTFGFFFLGFSGIAASAERPGSITSIGIALGFGLGLALMIFAFGHISGGHFNPAVTLGLACGRQFPWKEVLGYWGAQFVGGTIAAGIATALYNTADTAFLNSPGQSSSGEAFIAELIGTLLFLIVISAVATDPRPPWSGLFAPVAIGGYIFAASVVIGPFSSGSFNPARSIAPAVIAGDATDLWIYVAGPLAGGIIGGIVYLFVRRPTPAT
jgi:aquaporin NIP